MRHLRTWKLAITGAAALLMTAGCGGGNVGGSDHTDSNSYPESTITIVVPWSAGGGTDAVARALAKSMSEVGGVNVIVENREGAGSALGSGYVQRAKADGYTLLFNTSSVITQTYIGQKDGSNTVDFTQLIPVANVNSDPYTMQVNPKAKWNSLSELIDYAHANPGKVSIGVAGVGSQSQLLIPIIESAADVKLNQVAFDGSGPINTALMAGDVDAHAPTIGDFLSFIKDGSVKLLAVAADERLKDFPDVPTFKEQGLDIEYSVFRGIWTPAGTPDDVVKKIEDLVLKAADTDSFQNTLDDLGFGAAKWTKQEFQDVVDQQAVLLKKVMQQEGLID